MTNDEIYDRLLANDEEMDLFTTAFPHDVRLLIRAAANGCPLTDAAKDALDNAARSFRLELDIWASWSGAADCARAAIAREEHEAAAADAAEFDEKYE